MKNLILSALIIVSTLISANKTYSQISDTSFTEHLYSKSNTDTIRVKLTDNIEYNTQIELTINNLKVTDSLMITPEFDVKIIDVDIYDDYKEICISNGMNDYNDYSIFRYDGKKIYKIGQISSHSIFIVKGNGRITVRNWLGFWFYDYEYIYNEETNKLEKVEKDTYDIMTYSLAYNGYSDPIVVTEPFKTYFNKIDNSEVKFTTKENEEIKLIKAYIRVKCENEYIVPCVWILVENSNGIRGWARFGDFSEKVSGIPWAD